MKEFLLAQKNKFTYNLAEYLSQNKSFGRAQLCDVTTCSLRLMRFSSPTDPVCDGQNGRFWCKSVNL